MTVIYLWRIPRHSIFQALIHMAFDRFFLLRLGGVTFFKSLGTGTGERFTPSDADPTLWGLLVVTDNIQALDNSRVIRSWRKFALSESRTLLEPLSSHGLWAGKNPFFINQPANEKTPSGNIAAITRARIKWSKNFLFWRAVPPVTDSLHSQPGLISAIGIGEAPVGLQGTFSIWQDSAALRNFAYKGEAHAAVIEATKKHAWYAEELFARFHVVEMRGSIESGHTAE